VHLLSPFTASPMKKLNSFNPRAGNHPLVVRYAYKMIPEELFVKNGKMSNF